MIWTRRDATGKVVERSDKIDNRQIDTKDYVMVAASFQTDTDGRQLTNAWHALTPFLSATLQPIRVRC